MKSVQGGRLFSASTSKHNETCFIYLGRTKDWVNRIYVVDKRSKILDMETSVLNTQVVLHKEDQRYLGGEFPHCQGNIYLKFLIWSKQRII